MTAKSKKDDAAGIPTERVSDSAISITVLSDELDVSARALRFYEERGLIQPQRKGRARYYGEEDRRRIMMIMDGRRLGFTLTKISQLLEGSPNAVNFEENLTESQIARQLDALERQRQDIEMAISRLQIRYNWLREIKSTGRADATAHSADLGSQRRAVKRRNRSERG